MSINITIEYSSANELAFLTEALANQPAMHERIARQSLLFVKNFGSQKAQTEHRTATNLGARPTRHLERAYAGIESQHDASSARLLVPRASRLRAAFGAYMLIATAAGYLTLAVHPDAYGRRAREFEDLFPIRVGPRQSLVLVREVEGGGLETMYFLTKSVNIPEDASLIPFQEIFDEAADAVEAYLDEAIERSLS